MLIPVPLVVDSPPGAVLTRYVLPEQVTFLSKASISRALANGYGTGIGSFGALRRSRSSSSLRSGDD